MWLGFTFSADPGKKITWPMAGPMGRAYSSTRLPNPAFPVVYESDAKGVDLDNRSMRCG